MQQLNENIKNHYKQRFFESLLNENIQVDEQVGRIVVRGLKALKGTLDPKYSLLPEKLTIRICTEKF